MPCVGADVNEKSAYTQASVRAIAFESHVIVLGTFLKYNPTKGVMWPVIVIS